LAVLVVVVMLVIYAMISGLVSGPQAFERSDLVAPSMTVLEDDGTDVPGNLTTTYWAASLKLGFEYMPVSVNGMTDEVTAFVYQDCGGIIDKVTVENDGSNDVFVWSMGVRWDGNSTVEWNNCSVLIGSGEDVDLGSLYIDGPGASGTYSFELILDIWTSSPGGLQWYDYGDYYLDSDLELESVQEPEYEDRTVTLNEEGYYNTLNELVDFDIVSGWVTSIQGTFPGDYDLLQVIAAFELVTGVITYLSDDSDQYVGDDHWQSAGETMGLGTGDCEDQAVLMASIVTALGGNCRINLISGHAFPTVYIGDSENETLLATECVQAYYGTDVPVFWTTDELGYWMVIDTAGMCYAGGYPASSEPIDPEGGSIWNFEYDSYIDMIDVTGEPASTLFS
jgi:hypothetical protein